MENLKTFCSILRKRSLDHVSAASLVEGNVTVMFSILRQELDSMIRVIYLLSLPSIDERKELVRLTLSNKNWITKTKKGKERKITDREMVELSNKLMGWTQSVYKFGCAFIHLSSFHGYENDDPLFQLNDIEKEEILAHLKNYHHIITEENLSFEVILKILPDVLKKISMNLECYIQHLEKNEIFEFSEI